MMSQVHHKLFRHIISEKAKGKWVFSTENRTMKRVHLLVSNVFKKQEMFIRLE